MAEQSETEAGMPEKLRILLADDEAEHWLPLLKVPLQQAGIEVLTETDAHRVLTRLEQDRPDVLLLDVLFPAGRGDQQLLGREILPRVVETYPELPVVMFTTTLADDAFQLGTRDFPGAAFVFSKSVFHEEPTEGHDPYADLASRLRDAVDAARQPSSLDARVGFVVGSTPAMRDFAASLIRVAATNAPVLIYGETGTGKELVAKSLHTLSPRRERPLVTVNCGALTDELLGSALFGHEKGAFTGALKMHRGYFETADGGSLFLDEVQNMSPRLQQNLLRVLQEGVITRVGGETPLHVDVRVIAATNEDLETLAHDGAFRADLYYRLNCIHLDVPPLRERKDDIGELFAYFVNKSNRKNGTSISSRCRRDLLDLLKSYDWPGNVRELELAVERAIVLCSANLLTPENFSQLRSLPRSAEDRSTESEMTSRKGGYGQALSRDSKLGDATVLPDTLPARGGGDSLAKILTDQLESLPIEERYPFLSNQKDTDLRKAILIEFVCRLRQKIGQQVTPQLLVKNLHPLTDWKKDYDKVRRFVWASIKSPEQLECNQP